MSWLWEYRMDLMYALRCSVLLGLGACDAQPGPPLSRIAQAWAAETADLASDSITGTLVLGALTAELCVAQTSGTLDPRRRVTCIFDPRRFLYRSVRATHPAARSWQMSDPGRFADLCKLITRSGPLANVSNYGTIFDPPQPFDPEQPLLKFIREYARVLVVGAGGYVTLYTS